MYDKIWNFVSSCYESGFIPHEDDVYTEFEIYFDNGESFDQVEEVISSFVECSDLSGVEIHWEGELDIEPCYLDLKTAI